MADVFTTEKRSAIMSRVKGRNTKPERIVRSQLHRMGYRFRLHDKSLPGKPDIVLSRHKKIIFVNGCFWHRHPGCRKSKLPETNTEFWEAKLSKTVKRDSAVRRKLRSRGWKVLTIWECETRDLERIRARLSRFMEGSRSS